MLMLGWHGWQELGIDNVNLDFSAAVWQQDDMLEDKCKRLLHKESNGYFRALPSCGA